MKPVTTEKYKLDTIDKLIINALIENGRESFTGIAYYAKTSRTTVKTRIDQMTDAGIIEGYTALINRDLIEE